MSQFRLLLLLTLLFAGTTQGAQAGSLGELPKRALGVVCGTIVGTPVNVIRRPIAEEKYGIRSMVKDTEKKRLTIPAAIFYFPFAVTVGVLESPASALKRSVLNADKPFSKEQFSLGKESNDENEGKTEVPQQDNAR